MLKDMNLWKQTWFEDLGRRTRKSSGRLFVCLLTGAISAPAWSGSFERNKFGAIEEEKNRSCSLCNCWNSYAVCQYCCPHTALQRTVLVNVLMEIIFRFREDRARSTWKVTNVNHVFRAKHLRYDSHPCKWNKFIPLDLSRSRSPSRLHHSKTSHELRSREANNSRIETRSTWRKSTINVVLTNQYWSRLWHSVKWIWGESVLICQY